MQIVCPNCRTSYQIAAMAIGSAGRSVRCARCQNRWHVAPPPEEAAAAPPAEAPPPAEPVMEAPVESPPAETAPPAEAAALIAALQAAPEEPAESPPVALSDIPIPVERTPGADDAQPHPPVEIDNERPDVESVAARRARAAALKRRRRSTLPLAAAIAGLMVISGALLGLRKEAVRHAPQLASFYSAIGLPVNLRGLAFADLKIGNEIHDGVPVLVIEGVIVSVTSKEVDLPRLRFSLRSASGAEVYSWTAPPSQATLGPFEAVPFRSRLASPPAEGHDVQVRFFTRRDAVASVR
jgi:predicted Zn finger-like uncharacterized protein